MRKRDLEILSTLEKFKVMDSKMIAALHFSSNADPLKTANRVLKRLRQDGYIQANTDRPFQHYLYYLNPSAIKINSAKLDHHLMIGQTYVDMLSYDRKTSFEVERKLEGADFISDGFADWLGRKWFIECQNSLFSTKQLSDKLDKYKSFYEKGFIEKFPNVLIIGKLNMQFNREEYPFKISQVNSIHDLKGNIEKYKQKKTPVNKTPGIYFKMK